HADQMHRQPAAEQARAGSGHNAAPRCVERDGRPRYRRPDARTGAQAQPALIGTARPQAAGRHVPGGGTMRHCLGTIAAIFVGALLWFAHGAPAVAEQSLLETVLGRGKLVVATWSTAPPLCFTDDKGQLVGFDIDIARMISKGLLNDESKVEFIVVTSEGRWPAVLSGRADFGIADTTVYPDRAIRVAFTRPYMDSGISVLVRKDADVHTLAALN